jgi:tetratricopeptide (TPR) repeat protein/tRNA A-37 threonylcarbamoyl transferase component Bud32
VSAGGAGNVVEEQPEQTGTALFRGGMIGRYIVLGLLGKGGMGVVYSAYDPELDRKVALKLLRVIQGRKGADLDAKRTRLLREAKAIARLSHPNVVVVYDVGTFQDQVFIAMELVDGLTATRWRDVKKPKWKEVLQVFIAAGEGIAAAHAADLIHRDFKPDNVMVTRDGKVRVMDFGLARTMERVSEDTPVESRIAAVEEDNATLPGSRPHESRLTNEGNVVGTPAYMPPEQYLGVTDERSDQFSFCVSLYECLYGQHPFEARTGFGLTGNIQAGRVHEAPPNTKVPLWVRKILLKGLKPRPEDRYPSMRELLDALARDPAVARKRWVIAGAALAAAGALALGVQRAADTRRAFCAAGPEKLASTWELPAGVGGEGPRHSLIRKAFLATGKPYAPDAIRGVVKLLDDYAIKWERLYRDACEATHVRGEQSPDLLDLRMGCLNEQLSGLHALTEVFASATGEVVEHALDAAHALRTLDTCNDVRQLKAVVRPPSPEVAVKIDALRKELGQIKALHDAGRYARAIERLGPLVKEAEQINYKPLQAEARSRLGLAYIEQGQKKEAEAAYSQAFLDSIASHHDDLMAEITANLVWVVGSQRRFAEAAQWMRMSEAVVERTTGFDSTFYAWLLNNMGAVQYTEGRLSESVEYYRQSLRLKERLLGTDDPDVAATLGNIALSLGGLKKTQEALSTNDRAVAILRRTLGSSHPRVANELSNRGEVLISLGLFADALKAYDEAERIWNAALGTDDPSVAFALTGRGRALVGLHRPAEAIPVLEKALTIRETYDRDPSRLGEVEFALSRALTEAHGPSQRAESLARRALSDYSQMPGFESVKAEISSHLSSHRIPAEPVLTSRSAKVD